MLNRLIYSFMLAGLFVGLLFNMTSGAALAGDGDDNAANLKLRLWENPLGLSSLAPVSVPVSAEAALATATLPAESLTIGHATRLAFQSFRDGNWNIYTAKGNGLELRRPDICLQHPKPSKAKRRRKHGEESVQAL